MTNDNLLPEITALLETAKESRELLQTIAENTQHIVELGEVITSALFWLVTIGGFGLGLTVMTLFAIAWRKG